MNSRLKEMLVDFDLTYREFERAVGKSYGTYM
jgi:hypothetical protein